MSELIRWNPALFLMKAGLIIEVKIRITSYSTFAPFVSIRDFACLPLVGQMVPYLSLLNFLYLVQRKARLMEYPKRNNKIRVKLLRRFISATISIQWSALLDPTILLSPFSLAGNQYFLFEPTGRPRSRRPPSARLRRCRRRHFRPC